MKIWTEHGGVKEGSGHENVEWEDNRDAGWKND